MVHQLTVKKKYRIREKYIIDARIAKLACVGLISYGLVHIATGLSDMHNNPQTMSTDQIKEIYDRGVAGEPYVAVKSTQGSTNGILKTVLGVVSCIGAMELFFKPSLKNDDSSSKNIPAQNASHSALQPVDTKAEPEITDADVVYDLAKLQVFQNYKGVIDAKMPQLREFSEAKSIVCLGGTGTGKTTFASVLATLLTVERGRNGSAINIYDAARDERNTRNRVWFSGAVHRESSDDLIDIVKGQNRHENSPFDVVVLDELGKTQREQPELFKTAMVTIKERIRNLNRTCIVTAHSIGLEEFGGESMRDIRKSVLSVSTIVYFPDTKDENGDMMRSNIAFFRHGWDDYIGLPVRIGNTDQFENDEDWGKIPIANDFHPHVAARKISLQIAACGLAPKYHQPVLEIQHKTEIDRKAGAEVVPASSSPVKSTSTYVTKIG